MKPGFRFVLLVLLAAAAIYPPISLPALLAQEPKKPAHIEFKDGTAIVKALLKTDDDKDKVVKQPCKIFAADFKSGQNYQIDMVSKELDSYLRLEDPAGMELAKDDDSGGMVNARIKMHCRAEGPTASFAPPSPAGRAHSL